MLLKLSRYVKDFASDFDRIRSTDVECFSKTLFWHQELLCKPKNEIAFLTEPDRNRMRNYFIKHLPHYAFESMVHIELYKHYTPILVIKEVKERERVASIGLDALDSLETCSDYHVILTARNGAELYFSLEEYMPEPDRKHMSFREVLGWHPHIRQYGRIHDVIKDHDVNYEYSRSTTAYSQTPLYLLAKHEQWRDCLKEVVSYRIVNDLMNTFTFTPVSHMKWADKSLKRKYGRNV